MESAAASTSDLVLEESTAVRAMKETIEGKVVLVGNTLGSSATLDIPKATVKTVKINACGFGSFKDSDSAPLPTTFKVGSTTYTVAILIFQMEK
ncbi:MULTISPECIES: hypothetical protein [unclassified Nostoc]|uniref:hypothetical protein n=1 Tax=unclassified Nostoc TaxID=2593658 RepID=UPI002AD325EB|nr:hypothetical protein [Nostoc sp. DedQUE03]MDZ7976436.1 hypothetical protein [Nostoc sp. DedQUE03]MDZ8042762.1 hypothetical protein [Nostoc sp. DedQUE02]